MTKYSKSTSELYLDKLNADREAYTKSQGEVKEEAPVSEAAVTGSTEGNGNKEVDAPEGGQSDGMGTPPPPPVEPASVPAPSVPVVESPTPPPGQ